jgi:hypothetical protein
MTRPLLAALLCISASAQTSPAPSTTPAAQQKPPSAHTNPAAKAVDIRTHKAVAELKQLAEQVPNSDGTNDFTRAFIFANIGEALLQAAPADAERYLEKSLDASAAREVDEEEGRDLQSEIVQFLSQLDLNAALSYADSNPENPEFRELVVGLLASRDADRAAELMITWPRDNAAFPYDAALQLLNRFKADDPRTEQIFHSAGSAYQTQSDQEFSTYDAQFANILIQQADRLPHAEVLYWIDRMLSDAQKPSANVAVSVHNHGSARSASFDSMYQFCVAQFLPILRRLAPEKASQLESDNKVTDESISLASTPQAKSFTSISQSAATAKLVAARSNAEAELRSSIERNIKSDPRQALALASAVPEDSRADALTTVIAGSLKSSPDVALDAVRTLLKTAQELAEKWPKDSIVLFTFTSAMQLPTLARSSTSIMQLWCTSMPTTASLISKHDSDPQTSNEAPEVYWPSTVAQLTLASKCGKFDPALTKQVLKEVDDPAIRLLVRVRQLREELSANEPGLLVQCKVKHGEFSLVSACE